ACAFGSRDRVASGGDDRILRIWENGQVTMQMRRHENAILALSFSPTEPIIVSASKDHTLRLWSLDSQSLVHTITDAENAFTACAFNDDGSQIIAGTDQGKLILYARSSNEVTVIDANVGAAVKSCGFSAKSRLVYAVSAAGLRLWTVSSLKPLTAFRADPPLACGALNGDLMALGDTKGKLSLLQL